MQNATSSTTQSALQSIVLGGGCFWCTEAVFLRLKGVVSVTSGYMGGDAATANYKSVCTGATGHVEVIKVDYDPAQIALDDLLNVFFISHDPTTLNRQGADVGTQYASVIFYADDIQYISALAKINALKMQGVPVVTELREIAAFYPAESYHQDYYANNPSQSYCTLMIPPKLDKLRTHLVELLKDNAN